MKETTFRIPKSYLGLRKSDGRLINPTPTSSTLPPHYLSSDIHQVDETSYSKSTRRTTEELRLEPENTSEK